MANELALMPTEEPADAGHEVETPPSTGTLIPLTEEAQHALGGKDSFTIPHYPFKVGRESRSPGRVPRIAAVLDRRLRKVAQLNDLYLIERPSEHGFHVSREHFVIERLSTGLVLTDRASACGTRVADRAIGADSKDVRTVLRDGDVITVGSEQSPFVFEFRCS